MMDSGISIIKETPDYLVICKKAGIPSAPLNDINQKDKLSVIEKAAIIYPDICNVLGKQDNEYGLLHRIDTGTTGLLLIARNQKFYEHISECQKKDLFIKKYTAICNHSTDSSILQIDETPYEGMIIKSRFRAYGPNRSLVKPVFINSGTAALKKASPRFYETQIIFISSQNKDGLYQITCRITRGFRHQVRAHLACCGYPVYGDTQYNPEFYQKEHAEPMLFFASSISFPLLNGEQEIVNLFEDQFTSDNNLISFLTSLTR